MKAKTSERQRSGNILGVKRDSRNCIMKAAAATSIEYAGLSEEMNDCLLQLSDMVPHVPRNEKGNIEAAVLIQYVIDYILDLSQQLGGQDPFCLESSPLHCIGESREPLSEKSLENIVSNSCQDSQSPTITSNSVSSSLDFDIRPPSKWVFSLNTRIWKASVIYLVQILEHCLLAAIILSEQLTPEVAWVFIEIWTRPSLLHWLAAKCPHKMTKAYLDGARSTQLYSSSLSRMDTLIVFFWRSPV